MSEMMRSRTPVAPRRGCLRTPQQARSRAARAPRRYCGGQFAGFEARDTTPPHGAARSPRARRHRVGRLYGYFNGQARKSSSSCAEPRPTRSPRFTWCAASIRRRRSKVVRAQACALIMRSPYQPVQHTDIAATRGALCQGSRVPRAGRRSNAGIRYGMTRQSHSNQRRRPPERAGSGDRHLRIYTSVEWTASRRC